jgi:hypothetical protein
VAYGTAAASRARHGIGGACVRRIVNDPVRKHEEVGEIAVSGGGLEYADVLSPMSLTVYTTG